jgi:hypothetical protein
MREPRRHSTVYAATRYSCEIRASLLRTNRAADSKPRRFGAERGIWMPGAAAAANRGRLRLSTSLFRTDRSNQRAADGRPHPPAAAGSTPSAWRAYGGSSVPGARPPGGTGTLVDLAVADSTLLVPAFGRLPLSGPRVARAGVGPPSLICSGQTNALWSRTRWAERSTFRPSTSDGRASSAWRRSRGPGVTFCTRALDTLGGAEEASNGLRWQTAAISGRRDVGPQVAVLRRSRRFAFARSPPR